MKVTLSLRLNIERARPEPDTGPESPEIYDLSPGLIEKADQWDHDKREPIGFRGKEGA